MSGSGRNRPQPVANSSRAYPLELRRRAYELRAAGMTGRQIAAALQVGRSTVQEWLQTPEAAEQVARVADRIEDETVKEVGDLKGIALETLRDAMTGDAPVAVKVHAALGVLKYTEVQRHEVTGALPPEALAALRGLSTEQLVQIAQGEQGSDDGGP